MTPWALNPQVPNLTVDKLQRQLEFGENILLEHDFVEYDIATPDTHRKILATQARDILA